jgi:hypothetical protein
MPRFTTSAGTERRFLGFLLVAELVLAGVLIAWPSTTSAVPAAVPASSVAPGVPLDPTNTRALKDGRTATLMSLGGAATQELTERIADELDGAVAAVTAFWGDDWPRHVLIVAAGTDREFVGMQGGTPDNAATTTSERILFAPGAAAMSAGALRIVLRHELFHYASRSETATDAPWVLTEGVADFVGRPAQPRPGPGRAAELARLPTDADFDGEEPARSLAYDRAWWFSRFVADQYGTPKLRSLYLAACGHGHADLATAAQHSLGADLNQVLVAWRQWLSG